MKHFFYLLCDTENLKSYIR